MEGPPYPWSVRYDFDQIFSRPAQTNSGIKHFTEWLLSVENFEIFASTKIGSNGGAHTGQKRFYNTFHWFFFSKPEQESHNSSKNATPFYLFGFCLSVFATTPCQCRAGRLLPPRSTSTRLALHTSAFTMVFHGIAHARPYASYNNINWHPTWKESGTNEK